MESIAINLKNGSTLKGCSWIISNPKFNVVIMHGMEEYIGRYDCFAKYLNSKGISVYGLDMFGHGSNVNKNLSNLGEWPCDGFSQMVDANEVLISGLKSSKIPTYIFAHSYGTFIAKSYAQRYPNSVDKIILCGAGCKKFGIGLGKAIGHIVCRKSAAKPAKLLKKLMFGGFNDEIQFPKTAYDWLSVNMDNVYAYLNDPLCGFGSSNLFCYNLLCELSTLYKKDNVEKMNKNLSLFLISGEHDPVTSYSRSLGVLKELYSKAGIKNIDTKVYEGLRHEILNEKNWEVVASDIVNFYSK